MPQPSADRSLSASGTARSIAGLPGGGRYAVWQGFVASVCMMLGGLGVGWMASGSSLIRVPFFIVLRDNPVLVVICTVLVAFGGLFLVRAWLRLGQRVGDWGAVHPLALCKIAALWCAPLMLTFPLFSRDVYAYIGQGRLMVAGLNPYVNGISALNNYHNLGPDSLWTEAPTPYGPVFLWIEQAIVWVSGGNLEVAIALFRVVAAVGVVLCAIAVIGLAQHYGLQTSRKLWLTVANPLFVINFIASIHNDALMLGLVLLGLLAVVRRRPVLGIVLATLSIGIKPITLIALPFIGLLWAGQRAGWGRKIGCWALTAIISGAILTIEGAVTGFWFGWLPAMTTSGTIWTWYAPFGLLSVTAATLVQSINGPADLVAELIKAAGRALGMLAALWFVLRGSSERIMLRMALALTAVVVTAAAIQPWYVTWLAAFFALAGIAEGWYLRAYYLATVFFTVIALTDQLDVFDWIPLIAIRAVAIALSVVFVAYMMFWDWKTRALFTRGPALSGAAAAR
jgi:hypothetical protein